MMKPVTILAVMATSAGLTYAQDLILQEDRVLSHRRTAQVDWNAEQQTRDEKRMMRAETKADNVEADIGQHGELSLIDLQEHAADIADQQLGADCEFDEWDEWTVCQFTCGGGTSIRSRRVKSVATDGGKACEDNVRETRECRKNDCPVDCTWNPWSDWSECTATCGRGASYQQRTTNPAQYGGAACNAEFKKVKDCSVDECPVDCKWSDWTSWHGCSKTCGGGKDSRTRDQTPGNAAGKSCIGTSTDIRECSQNTCPTDCVMNSWSEWSLCSVTCGLGSKKKHRSVNIPAAFGGSACGSTEVVAECQESKYCPEDCKYSEWTEWNSCSVSCGTGLKSRSRFEEMKASGNGKQCEGSASDEAECAQRHCPVDCQVTDWTSWTACSVSCGHGIAERHRAVTEGAYGGAACPDGGFYGKKPCSLSSCPVDCEFADWQDWYPCSASCGWGQSSRIRLVKTPAQVGGRECYGDSQQSRKCNERFCPVACQWDTWSDWSSCTKSCGVDSKQQRSRVVSVFADKGGAECNGPSSDERGCQEPGCPIHCQWLDWADWSKCSKSCGLGGTTQRSRDKIAAGFGGQECEGNTTQTLPCAHSRECPVDCEMDAWSEWGECSQTCGQGKHQRSRVKKTEAKFGGQACVADLTDEAECWIEDCAEDCKLSDWGEWSSCSASCSNGTSHRVRKILREAVGNGTECLNLELRSTKNCFTHECLQNCVWAEWSNWTACTKSCGGGYTSRSRTELMPARAGGKACDGSDKEESVCSAAPCPTDCNWETWSDWTDCSKSCGTGGERSTSRIAKQAAFGGLECDGESKITEKCSEHACPQDCQWSTWTGWSVCTVTCGGGISKRSRQRSIEQSSGGLPCIGVATEDQQCGTAPCPRDCEWGPWSRWTTCSKTCGGGTVKRLREVSVPAKYDGNLCLGSDSQEAECNARPCPQNCKWGEWAEWSDCSVSCDGGVRAKSRVVIQEATHHGTKCLGNSTDQEECNMDPCPVDCSFSEWKPWGDCSVSCGYGERARTRTKDLERNGGRECTGTFTQTETCSNDDVEGCPPLEATTTTEAFSRHSGDAVSWDPEFHHGGSHATGSPLPGGHYSEKNNTYGPPASLENIVHKNLSNTTTPAPIEPDASTEAIPASIHAVEAAMEHAVAHGSIGSGNITSVIDKILDVRSHFGTTSKNSLAGLSAKYGRKVAEVQGDLRLYVENADTFIGSNMAKDAVQKSLADLAGVQEEKLQTDMTITQAMLAPSWAKQAKGNVNVHYTVSIHENDNMGDTKSVTNHILPSNSDKVTSAIMSRLSSAGSKYVVKAVSLSLRVISLKDGKLALNTTKL